MLKQAIEYTTEFYFIFWAGLHISINMKVNVSALFATTVMVLVATKTHCLPVAVPSSRCLATSDCPSSSASPAVDHGSGSGENQAATTIHYSHRYEITTDNAFSAQGHILEGKSLYEWFQSR